MRFEIVTIFPGFFAGIFEHGIVRRAQSEGLVTIGIHDLRNFAHDRHRTVDDRPFGGGEGMVLKPEPLAEALQSLRIKPKSERNLSPICQGRDSAEAGNSERFETGHDFSRAEPVTDEKGALAPEAARNNLPDAVLKGHDFSRAENTKKGAGASAPKPARNNLPDAVLKGHDFSRAENTEKGAEALAPESARNNLPDAVLKGHDFSRAENTEKGAGALAPEGQDAGLHTAVILLSAQGRPFTQAVARTLAQLDRIVLLCGRYEGVDERINELYCDMELSIGDYVLSGGELAAAVVADAVIRLIPGVLGNQASGEFESFGIADTEITADIEGVPRSQHGSGGLLDYPHYTRPAEFGGLRAPDVLLNGDHQQIRRWRREQQLRKTLRNRPDLIEPTSLSQEERRLLDRIRREPA
jgi:tRNA (guanine37-N1)-methyltransferase